ncbi:MAG: tricarballylate utilization 4Fe-4S protein TcuB [Thermoplasmatales archaeon]
MSDAASFISNIEESERQYMICNACRHCEGFCPVWDAMERRNFLEAKDIKFFSYLCHDCRDCFYACPYSEPHEFGLNIPKMNSTVRYQIHSEMAWPRIASSAVNHSYLVTSVIFVISIVSLFLISIAQNGFSSLFAIHPSFYNVISYSVMDDAGLALGFYIIIMWIIQGLSFWASIGGKRYDLLNIRSNAISVYEVISHKWFKGGGVGCDYPLEHGTKTRMFYHSAMFFGFLSAFVATAIAAYFQRVLAINPPYSFLSEPVFFGVIGGLLMILGGSGFLYMKQHSEKDKADFRMLRSDYLVIVMLIIISITGLTTLLLRSSSIMAIVLIIHLSLVATLFAIVPFSKMNHIIFRYLALLKNNVENRKVMNKETDNVVGGN